MHVRIWIVCVGWVLANAAVALSQEKVADVASLILQLSDDSFSQRQAAMQDLTGMGLSAIPSLTNALCDSDPETRWRAARTLEEIGLQGDERTLRKVTRIMHLLGTNGISGLAEKSAQMRELWLESQVQRITNNLIELGATVDVVSGYATELDGQMSALGGIAVAPEKDLAKRSALAEGAVTDREPSQPMDLAVTQQSIAEIIAADDEADDRALAELQMDPPKSPLDASSVENPDEIVWAGPPEIGQVQFRNVTIDANWKGKDQDWALLSRVNRLARLSVAARTLTADQWGAIADISSLRYIHLDKCKYDLADAFAFRDQRSDVVIRIVGRGFSGVMGPLDGLATECVISQVVPETGAAKAGLQVDDEIISINGKHVRVFQDLVLIVGSLDPGDEIKLEYRRGDAVHETTAVLQPRNEFDR